MSESAHDSRIKNGLAVIPHLVCVGADKAIDFYVKAFGMKEMMRLPAPDGRMLHGAVQFGDSMIMLADAFPEFGSTGPQPGTASPVTIHLQVPNVDEVFAQAVAAGATVVMPVDDMFWGDRYGIVDDPFGHRWSIATTIKNVSPDELRKAASEAMPGCP